MASEIESRQPARWAEIEAKAQASSPAPVQPEAQGAPRLERVNRQQRVWRRVAKMQSQEAQQIYRPRGPVAELPNAWIKAKMGLPQFRLRGLLKVTMGATWACLTYNLQQWIRLCWRKEPALGTS